MLCRNAHAGRKPNGLDLNSIMNRHSKLEIHTFSLQVQFVVKMTVDLFGLTITFKESSEDSHTLHPHKLLGHTGIFGTLPLTKASVTAFTSGLGVITNAGARMDSNGLFDDL